MNVLDTNKINIKTEPTHDNQNESIDSVDITDTHIEKPENDCDTKESLLQRTEFEIPTAEEKIENSESISNVQEQMVDNKCVSDNACVKSEIYDFRENVNPSESKDSKQNKNPKIEVTSRTEESKKETDSGPPWLADNSNKSSECPCTPPRRGLKLTLRVKRSPVVEEVMDCGNATEATEYEVLRLEGVDPETARRLKKRRRSKERHRKHSPIRPLPPMKRLRLIFGNESRTIDLPTAISAD